MWVYELSVMVDLASKVRIAFVGRFEDNLRVGENPVSDPKHLVIVGHNCPRPTFDPFVSLWLAR